MSDTTIRDSAGLIDAGLARPEHRAALDRVGERYAVAIPPALAALVTHPADPLGRQFIPDPAELHTAPHEHPDPIGDDAFSPVPGIVHRYPDRALLKPLLICPVYCRFCFRREHVGPEGGLLSQAALDTAYAWLRAHPAIREVILTGGDPLMLSPRRLADILAALAAIPHIALLRIHTRLPVADPARLLALADTLDIAHPALAGGPYQPPARIDPRRRWRPCAPCSAAACRCWARRCCCAAVNDDPATLEALFRAMLAARIKPYYLHQLDPGARHRAVRRADRRGPGPDGRPARARDRPGLADLRAGHPRRPRQGAHRTVLPDRGCRAGPMGRAAPHHPRNTARRRTARQPAEQARRHARHPLEAARQMRLRREPARQRGFRQ